MATVYSIEAMNNLRQIKSRSDPACRVALRALRRLEQLGPTPNGRTKRLLPQFAPHSVCQFVFLRGGRTILVRYELDGNSFTIRTSAVRASPRW
jgi:hypothetical protein